MTGPSRIIGLDLDNTIIRYDRLFHRLALKRGLIFPWLPPSKAAIRDYIRDRHGDEAWQELQALAYGPELAGAELFPGAAETLAHWRARGLSPAIVSHKTVFSAKGAFELRPAALEFLRTAGIMKLILARNVHFVDQADHKVELIGRLNCQFFVDDLPQILRHPKWPPHVGKILFDPTGHRPPGLTVCADWAEIKALALARCFLQPDPNSAP